MEIKKSLNFKILSLKNMILQFNEDDEKRIDMNKKKRKKEKWYVLDYFCEKNIYMSIIFYNIYKSNNILMWQNLSIFYF